MVVGNKEDKDWIVFCSVAYMVIITRCGKVILHCGHIHNIGRQFFACKHPRGSPRAVTTSHGQMEQLHLAQSHGKDGEKLMTEQIGRRQ